jgi:hypothetical protein
MARIPPQPSPSSHTSRFPGAKPRGNPPPAGGGRTAGPKPPMPVRAGPLPGAGTGMAKPMQAFKDGGSVKSMKGFGNSAGGAKSYGKKGKC